MEEVPQIVTGKYSRNNYGNTTREYIVGRIGQGGSREPVWPSGKALGW